MSVAQVTRFPHAADRVSGVRPERPADSPSAPLWTLLTGPAANRFTVVSAPVGLHRPVRGTIVWSERARDLIGRHDLLLVEPRAVVDEGDRLVEAAAAGEATGIVVSGSAGSLGERANELGIALIEVDAGFSWDTVELLVRGRMAMACAGATLGPHDAAGLYELARVAATLLCAPVEITDEHLRTLAFENLSFPIDELRKRSILDRRPPASMLEWLSHSGVLARLRESRDPVRVDPPGAWPRLVAVLRGQRQQVLGYVCVAQMARPFGPHDAQILADAAVAIAQHQATEPASARAETKSEEDVLVEVLTGRSEMTTLTSRLRRAPDTRWCVIGLRERSGRCEPTLIRPMSRQGILPGGVVTELEGRIYLVVPCEATGSASALAARAASSASSLSGRTMVACAGEPITADGNVTAVRHAVDRGLDVLAGASEQASATVTELRSSLLLAEIGELVRERPHLLAGPLDSLLAKRTRRNADYLSSLSAYFRCGCDLGAAAGRLYIHRNTLRYRLNRVQELCQIDLEDPTERFVVELQLRLLELGDSEAVPPEGSGFIKSD